VTGRLDWVLLAYRLPREPSTPRIAVWRKLRRLGVAQVLDGLVALPSDARSREQLEWVAAEIVDAQGEATVWIARLGTVRQERELAAAMAAAVAKDYRALSEAATTARDGASASSRRTLSRLRRELHRIAGRDYFPPPEREAARQAVEAFAATLVEV
jgi:hypothetical protein